MLRSFSNYTPKEISWLAFNDRVLQEAENPSNPIIERMKFLGIYSNNQDEYFRVRVATLKRLSKLSVSVCDVPGADPGEILEMIQNRVKGNRGRVENALCMIKQDLDELKVRFVDETQILPQQALFIKEYFYKKIRPLLMPIIMNEKSKVPDLKDDAVYFAVKMTLTSNDDHHKTRYALMKIPSNRISRFVVLPEVDGYKYVMFIDDVIRYKLKTVFKIFNTDTIEAYEVKITKDAELDIDDNISYSYLDRVNESLKHRKRGRATRFVYDQLMPPDLLDFLLSKFKFKRSDVLLPGGRYFNYKDFMKFPTLHLPEYEPLPNIPVHRLEDCDSIFAEICKRNVMLFFPYHSFDYFIDFLREASIDPRVTSIKITLYRVGRNSSVVNALINALRNGKDVTVIFELQARFDEEANIYWSKQLQEAGAHVIFGVSGLKVHSKICLITRKNSHSTDLFSCVSTGNFNEDTAKYYTDTMLLTNNEKITKDLEQVFQFLLRNYKRPELKCLPASPFTFRNTVMDMLDTEIRNAKAGKKAWIYLKLNNLTDPLIVQKLYDASSAGVEIKVVVRGMLSLHAGIEGLSENIHARGLVDRYLEHTRVYITANGGERKTYISSADLMTRNLDRRVEVSCPILDKEYADWLLDIFLIQWKDSVKNRILDPQMRNFFATTAKDEPAIRSQYEIHKYLLEKKSI